MPEGHVVHRLATGFAETFGGRAVRVDSPQGKFAEGAALVSGQRLAAAEAHGKHLFLGFLGPGGERVSSWIHIHLGLYGTLGFGAGPAPAPAGAIRLRLATAETFADLRGPTVCELVTAEEKRAIQQRLGPDPLRADADPEPAWRRISASRTPLAALLLDQTVLAGAGNVYRAEVLFRQGIDPYRPGRALTRREWQALWADLGALMREGVVHGRIDTVRPAHTPKVMGRPPREDEHGGEVYVYRRAGQPCLVCGTAVSTAVMTGRNLYWCPACQGR